MTDYEKQAKDFLDETKTTFKALFVEHGKHFPDDKEDRDIFSITLTKGDRHYTFKFGQSIANAGIIPKPYDVLACLQNYDVGDFENFCGDFGYDIDSIKAKKSYDAVVNEYNQLKMLYSDAELEKMAEIN